MKVVHVYGPDEVRIEDKAQPTAGDDDVIVKVSACGICGSDPGLVKLGSLFGKGIPMPLGHEFSGVISEVGRNIKSFKVGTRVAANPMVEGLLIGFGNRTEGAFSQYVRIRDAENVLALHEVPAGIAMDVIPLVEPIAVGMHCVNIGGPSTDDTVVIYGAGAVGLGALIWLIQLGVEDVYVVDVYKFSFAIGDFWF